MVDNRPIKFIIDAGSPETLIPKSKFNKVTTLKPITVDYRDVNDNEIKFEGRTTANVELDGTKHQLALLVTIKSTHPLLPSRKIQGTNQSHKQDRKHKRPQHRTLKRKFHKLFNENHTVNNVEVDIQLKEGSKLIQQKGRPILIQLQSAVGKEIEKLKNQGHIERANNIDETCFVGPAVITIKKDKSVKIALDSQKLNEITVKRKAQMPNMEELISRISKQIAGGPKDEIWISKFDLDYAYGQLQLSKRSMDFRIFALIGGNFTGYYCFLIGFFGLADIPTFFQEKIDQTLENKHPAWLDNTIVVTKGSK